MALATLKNRVIENSATTGTGTLTLTGVPDPRFQTFLAAMGAAAVTFYAIVHEELNEWEVGVGTVGSGATLTRSTVLASTNSNALVNFSTGTKLVFNDIPAEKLVALDRDSSALTLPGALSVAGAAALAALSATTAAFSGAVTASSTLGVTGATTLAGLSATTGAFSGTLAATGAVALSSTLAVTGATTLASTLGVTGASTLAGLSATTGSFSGTLGVTGATSLASTLGVTGAATLAGLSATTGSFSSTLGVSGATTLAALAATTGAFSGALTAASTLGVTGASTLAALSATTGSFSSTLGVTGASTLAAVSATTGTLSSTLAVSGATTLAALSATTGAFSGAITGATTLAITGASTFAAVSGTTGSFSGTLGVSGATTLSSTLAVTGASTLAALSATTGSFSSTLAVTGAATLSSTLAVTGAATLSSTLNIGGLTYVFPGSQTANRFLKTDGSGTLSWATILEAIALTDLSDVAITSQATGQILRASSASAWANSTATFPDTATAGHLLYASASNVWSGLTIGAANTVLLSTGSAPSWVAQSTLTAPAGLLTGTTLASNVVTSSLTAVGTLASGAVPASLVTAGTFGSGSYTFPGAVALTGALTGVTTITTSGAINGQTISSAASLTGTLAVAGAVTSSITADVVVTANASTTSRKYFQVSSDGANAVWGIEGVSAGSLMGGSSAYACVVGTIGATALQLGTNNNVRLTIDSAGAATFSGTLAVTGATTLSTLTVSSITTLANQLSSSNSGQFDIDSAINTGAPLRINRSGGTGGFIVFAGNTTTNNFVVDNSGNATIRGITTIQSTGGSGLRIYGGAGSHQFDVYLNGTDLRIDDNTSGGVLRLGVPLRLNNVAVASGVVVNTHTVTVKDSDGTTYRLLCLV